jgi:cyanophycinase
MGKRQRPGTWAQGPETASTGSMTKWQSLRMTLEYACGMTGPVRAFCRIVALAICVVAECVAQKAREWKYFRVGRATDAAQASPRAGYALMGGGEDLDEAFQWLCDRAGGGDLLVLRATGTDAYNPYIQKLCPKLNSVATLVVPNRDAAQDVEVTRRITHASALLISGGDQGNYINFWMGTPVQSALNDAIERGVPLGGTSAGLAVMGEWAYSAQGDKPDGKDLDSNSVLADPFHPRITLVHEFLDIPILKGVITDTHFAKRDRMGRLLAFLARLKEPDGKHTPDAMRYRGIGVEREAAVLVDPDGAARVAGRGDAYFIDATNAYGVVVGGKFGVSASHKPLTFGPFDVEKVAPGHFYDLASWTGDGLRYRLSIEKGRVRSTQQDGSIY